jgi:hypothetical protein
MVRRSRVRYVAELQRSAQFQPKKRSGRVLEKNGNSASPGILRLRENMLQILLEFEFVWMGLICECVHAAATDSYS